MTTARNNTPPWVLHLAAMLGTIGSTYAIIRSEVRNVVRDEMSSQLATVSTAVVHHMDSLAQTKAFDFDREQQLRAQLAMDTLMARIGLIAQHDGTHTTYSPRIVVQADTLAQQAIADQLEGLEDDMHTVMKALAQLAVKVEEIEVPNGKPKKREQTWPR